MSAAPAIAKETSAHATDPQVWLARHGDYLYRFATFRLRDRAAAEDVLQETLLAALQSRERFASLSTERTWEVRGEMLLSDFGRGLTPYPYMLLLEQSKNEELLYEYLRGHGKDVLWKTELESFSQDEAGVTARVKTEDGETQTITAQYLVGCDGAKSPVRHGMGLTFAGSTFERLFYVVDARVDWEQSHDAVYVCLAREVFTAFFPMKGESRYPSR